MPSRGEDTFALLPLRSLDSGKTRLSPLLDPAERAALIAAMAEDIMDAFAEFARMPVLVVTGDPSVVALAESRGFHHLMERDCLGETSAIDAAEAKAGEMGASGTLVVPCDVPLLRAEDVAAVTDQAPDSGTLFVPAWDGRGTNAVLRRPFDLFPLRFGNDSFLPHRASAEQTGLPFVIASNERIALDVDSPEDLFRLLDYGATGRTRSVLESMRLEQRR